MVAGRFNLRPWSMTEVTAEMIERGRGADPMVAANRRRRAREVRDAREKLTSSSSGHRAFDLELLRLYARRRKASAAWLGLLGVGFVFATLRLALDARSADLGRPQRILRPVQLRLGRGASCVVPTSRSTSCAGSVSSSSPRACRVCCGRSSWCSPATAAIRGSPPSRSFALVLIAAINATVTASIPAAVYGALLPVTIAVVAMNRPARLVGPDALLALLAIGTLIYFVVLAPQPAHRGAAVLELPGREG